MTPQEQIALFIDECLEGTDCFLVSFKLKPTNNYKIYIDSDSGFTLQKAVSINRQLRKKIDETAFYPDGNYSLEVSSPGVDAPLTMLRQYKKNIGRKLEIELNNEEEKGIIARLIAITDEELTLEPVPVGRVKKVAEPAQITLLIKDIKTAHVCIEF